MNNIIKKFDLDSLPTLPTVYQKLLEKLEDPKATVKNITDTIILDISSTTKLLKIVNSSMFSFKSKIDTVSQAITLLGFNEVRNTILSIAVTDFFRSFRKEQGFKNLDLWKHSIAVAVISRIIGKEIGYKNTEQLFISGLVHDIGKLIMIKYYQDTYLGIILDSASQNESLISRELKILGFSHCDIGYEFTKKWNLSEEIAACVKYHHSIDFQSQYAQTIAVVYLANIIAKLMSLGYSGDSFIELPDDRIWEILNLKKGFLKSIYYDIELEINESSSLFKI